MSATARFEEKYPAVSRRGIDESVWNALCSTLYPSSSHDSVLMAIDYCKARGLDVMLKPVHLVPMQVKDPRTGKKEWRDVPMPGIGLYRIQADRSGNYAGADEPEFGPIIEKTFVDAYSGKEFVVSYPEWCKYTVYKMVNNNRVAFCSKEYWIENYATMKSDSDAPNSMWRKRPFGQLAKCAESQALRKGWPEIGAVPTAEEMEGKDFDVIDGDFSVVSGSSTESYYPTDKFERFSKKWIECLKTGELTIATIKDNVASKGEVLTEKQIQILEDSINETA